MNILEMIYYVGYRTARAYKSARRKRIGHRVISVGNLTLGGTGKTPAVIAIAEEALRRGFRPCVLTRGYRGRIRKPVIVSKGNGPLCSPFDAGDEAFLLAERLRGVEVIKAADRYAGSLLSEKANLFILDDGFQHWRLHRDHDILLVDSLDPFGNGRLFPLGKLRELPREAGRADTIVITRSSGEEGEIVSELRKYNGRARFYTAGVRPTWIVMHNGELLPAPELYRKRVFAFCGIGNPGSFIQSVLRFGVYMVGFRSFRDHHVYSDDDITRIRQEAVRTRADWVLMTEKDLVKLNRFKLPNNFAALRIDFEIESDFYDNIFNVNESKDKSGGKG